MSRTLLIAATIIATLIATIGFPLRLYACQMSQVRAERSACPGCVCRCSAPAHHMSKKAAPERPCCTFKQVLLKMTSSAVLSHAAMTVLSFVIVRAFDPAGTDMQSGAGRAAYWIDHPPPLARRSQSTYLFTSTFLI
jgi:hypothetical protein